MCVFVYIRVRVCECVCVNNCVRSFCALYHLVYTPI